MADKGASMTTDKRTCEWVRDWLPLLAGDGERVAGQSGDVSAEDRRLLEGHLDVCTSCRRRRTALEGALSLLDVVAAQPPVGREGVSVWPDLEGRMRRYHERERSRWMRVLRGYCPEGLRAAADRLRRGWEEVQAQLPFRVAWARDSAREFLESRGRVPQAIPAAGQVFPLDVLLPRLAVGLGLAFLLLLSIVPLVHRHQARAEAQIAAQRRPDPRRQHPAIRAFRGRSGRRRSTGGRNSPRRLARAGRSADGRRCPRHGAGTRVPRPGQTIRDGLRGPSL